MYINVETAGLSKVESLVQTIEAIAKALEKSGNSLGIDARGLVQSAYEMRDDETKGNFLKEKFLTEWFLDGLGEIVDNTEFFFIAHDSGITITDYVEV